MHHFDELGRLIAKILSYGAATKILEKRYVSKNWVYPPKGYVPVSLSGFSSRLMYDENHSDSVKCSKTY